MCEIVLDLETNGLIETVDTIWCATFHNVDKGISISFAAEHNKENSIYPINSMKKWILNGINNNYTWICHNIMKYDREVLKKILDAELPIDNCQDSYIWSMMLWPDISIPKGCKGKHGLDAWGTRFGIPKPLHEDWTKYSPEMLYRNQEDVKINTKLWLHIKEKIKQ
jgi:hypothetical protein